MADKDFKVKNKLFVNGLSHNSGVILATNNNLDSHTTVPTQYGGTGTTQSPNSGQVLYSSAGTNYVPTTLTSLDVKGATYSADAPASPVVGQIWVESDSAATAFDPNIVKRQSFTATAAQTVFTTSHTWIEGYEQVYLNGLLLLRTTDYTTSNSNTVTLVEAAAVNDILEVVTVTNFNVNVSGYTQDAAPESPTDGQIWLDTNGTLADTAYIANSIVDAKGDLITATSDNTPIRLARGTDGQYLKADSNAAAGLSWATLPASGKVLQVIQDTQENSTTTSSTSYVDSGLSVTITPSSTTSSILILAQFQGYVTNAGTNTNNYSTAALVRGSTQLQQAPVGTYSMAASTNPEFEYTLSFAHLDSPATTSATTYKVQYRAVSGQSSAMNIYGSSTIKNSIIVLEIGA